MTWTPSNGTFQGNPIERTNPYENWEKETRIAALKQSSTDGPWHPVFVRLCAEKGEANPYKNAAGKILDAVLFKDGDLPIGERLGIDLISLVFLLNAVDTHEEHFASFFVWRKASRAYHDIQDVLEVVHVGPESASLGTIPDPIEKTAEIKLVRPSRRRRVKKTKRNVITAVIDDQIGFAHERLRSAPDKTRLLGHFVHQTESFFTGSDDLRLPGLVMVGGYFTGSQISALLSQMDELDIYRNIDRLAARQTSGTNDFDVGFFLSIFGAKLLEEGFVPLREHSTSHGTFIADLAAGLHPTSEKLDERPVLGFDLTRLSTSDTSGTQLDVHSVLAVMFVTFVADFLLQNDPSETSPMVINFSYALRAGPKDGTGFAENEMARLVGARNRDRAPTWLVLPSGNGFRDHCHATLSPEQKAEEFVEWRVQPGDQTPSYVEIWSKPISGAELIVSPPAREPVCVELVPLSSVWNLEENGKSIARIFRQFVDGRLRITVAVAPTLHPEHPDAAAPSGPWLLTAKAGHSGFEIDLDVQRDDTPTGFPRYGRQSYFDGPNIGSVDSGTLDYTAPFPSNGPVQREYTLSSYATNESDQVIVAGGALDRDALTTAALYSASGPGMGGRDAPEISAVTEETRAHPARLGAGMFSGSTASFSGTSAAAALVTRRVVDAVIEDPSVDKSALILFLLEQQTPTPARDLQLGFGTAPFKDEPGRSPRRLRT